MSTGEGVAWESSSDQLKPSTRVPASHVVAFHVIVKPAANEGAARAPYPIGNRKFLVRDAPQLFFLQLLYHQSSPFASPFI